MSTTLDLAQTLIQQPSVTPNDAHCQDIIQARLTPLGFQCETMMFGDVKNLWAVRGDSGPLLAFAGHTDVVPTGALSEWRHDPFSAHIEDGYLYGRGAADMKGSLAAMVVATEHFVRQHPQHSGRLAFLLTSDEEGEAVDGTVRVLETLIARGEHIDMALVGEPSSSEQVGDVIKNGRRGSLLGHLTVHGKQGHVAYPQLADNPIHRLAPALTELVAEPWDSGNAFFPATSLQIANMNSGTGATNVIPGSVSLQFSFRFSTEVTPEQLESRVRAILDAHGLSYHLRCDLKGLPFLTSEGELVEATRAAVAQVTGQQAQLSTAGGTSDGRFIAAMMGSQVVELGPVNATIHQINERVRIQDLEQLSAIYQATLEQLLT